MYDTDEQPSPRRFRGHHLICLRHFDGTGCDPLFRQRLAEMSAELESGSGVITEGPDDLCIACPDYSLDLHACANKDLEECCVRAIDALACRLLGVRPGQSFDAATLAPLAESSVAEWADGACDVCEWADGCSLAGSRSQPAAG